MSIIFCSRSLRQYRINYKFNESVRLLTIKISQWAHEDSAVIAKRCIDEKISFYRSGYRSLFECKVRNFSTLLCLYMLREQVIFFLESRPAGKGVWWVHSHPSPHGLRRSILHTARYKSSKKQNSSIQFLPGQSHFLAHSSSFILRHWIHLSVLFVKMWVVYCMEIGNECQELRKISSRG